MKQLIVTADDFGLATEVNAAVEIAHCHGILSAASLMVGSPAAADAVMRAKRLPDLRVGLHLTLVEATPVLAPSQIPDLVTADGQLRSDMAAISLQLVRSASVRRQLAAEIEAQFAAFAATGLVLDHVNAHKHFHINPLVSGHVLRIGRRFGMRTLRVPREPRSILRAIEPLRGRAGDPLRGRAGDPLRGRAGDPLRGRAGDPLRGRPGMAERLLSSRLAGQARRAGLSFTDHVFGLAWTGALTAARLAALVGRLPDGSSEIYLHPATADRFVGSAASYRYRDEFAALTAADTRTAVRDAGALLCGYANL